MICSQGMAQCSLSCNASAARHAMEMFDVASRWLRHGLVIEWKQGRTQDEIVHQVEGNFTLVTGEYRACCKIS